MYREKDIRRYGYREREGNKRFDIDVDIDVEIWKPRDIEL